MKRPRTESAFCSVDPRQRELNRCDPQPRPLQLTAGANPTNVALPQRVFNTVATGWTAPSSALWQNRAADSQQLFTAKAEIKTFFLRAPSRRLGPTKLFPSRPTGHRWLHRLVSLQGFAAVTFSSCPINTEVSSKPPLFYLSVHLWLFWGQGLFGIAQP